MILEFTWNRKLIIRILFFLNKWPKNYRNFNIFISIPGFSPTLNMVVWLKKYFNDGKYHFWLNGHPTSIPHVMKEIKKE